MISKRADISTLIWEDMMFKVFSYAGNLAEESFALLHKVLHLTAIDRQFSSLSWYRSVALRYLPIKTFP